MKVQKPGKAVVAHHQAQTPTRFGVITKVFHKAVVIDASSINELVRIIQEKLTAIHAKSTQFSSIISFADQTHHEGGTTVLSAQQKLDTPRRTERVVLRWLFEYEHAGDTHQGQLIVRMANPVSPLHVLQAALSKSPGDIDSLETEMGAVCVSIDDVSSMCCDEFFLLFQNWLDARRKPIPMVAVHKFYDKHEWLIDQFGIVLLPLTTAALMGVVMLRIDSELRLACVPFVVACLLVIVHLGKAVANKMGHWSRRSRLVGLFDITSGDSNAITEMSVASSRAVYKLVGSWVVNILLNIVATALAIKIGITDK